MFVGINDGLDEVDLFFNQEVLDIIKNQLDFYIFGYVDIDWLGEGLKIVVF